MNNKDLNIRHTYEFQFRQVSFNLNLIHDTLENISIK